MKETRRNKRGPLKICSLKKEGRKYDPRFILVAFRQWASQLVYVYSLRFALSI